MKTRDRISEWLLLATYDVQRLTAALEEMAAQTCDVAQALQGLAAELEKLPGLPIA